MTNNNGIWMGWLDLLALLLQLRSTTTSHNQWLPKTRPIPYWNTSVFFSTVTNDERRISCDWIIQRWLSYEWLSLPFSRVLPFITPGEQNRDHYFQQCKSLRAYPLQREPCVNSVATLWFHYSGFQAVLTEPLPSNDHIRHNTVLLYLKLLV
jgi:hypothetical protein